LQLHGADALSMRGLAKVLGVSVMGLYHHVSSKEQLLDRLWSIVLDRVPLLSIGSDGWEAQLRTHAVAAVTLLSRYPGLLKHGISRPPTPIALSFGKHAAQTLTAGGFDPQTAALATATLHLYLLGTIVATELLSDLRAARKAGHAVDLEGLNTPNVDLATFVEFGADTFIAGLRARLPATHPRAASAPRSAKRRSKPLKATLTG
jgi:AcrR family transcriptional regulator